MKYSATKQVKFHKQHTIVYNFVSENYEIIKEKILIYDL